MLFCLTCLDKPDSLALRLANRDAHLDYWNQQDCVKIGGPFLSDDGAAMQGSMLVVDVPDRAEAERLAGGDPYARAGLFRSVDIRAWKWTI